MLNCFKYFQIYILGHLSQKNGREKVTMSNWLDVHKYVWTISSLCVLKWLDIDEDLWFMSSEKIFQYSQIAYIKSITQ